MCGTGSGGRVHTKINSKKMCLEMSTLSVFIPCICLGAQIDRHRAGGKYIDKYLWLGSSGSHIID